MNSPPHLFGQDTGVERFARRAAVQLLQYLGVSPDPSVRTTQMGLDSFPELAVPHGSGS